MSNSRDFLVFNYIVVIYLYLIIVVNQSNSRNSIFVNGKSLDNLEDKTCENVKYFFDLLNVTVNGPNFDKKGEICDGHCCDNKAENELLIKSINNLERLLQSHKRGIRGILERTAIGFRDHVLELSRQSENKTLNLFSQVYRKMSPLSRRSIMELYESIRSHISIKDGTLDLDEVTNRFFINLFPVAYHHAVDESSSNGDFHIDYKNCLTHAYSELQPFGEVPKQLSKNLVQSVGAATVLLKSLDQASTILSNTEKLDAEYISERCKIHLLKMSYCTECKGMTKAKVKTCSAYCLNVMRGCLTQYIATIDAPWSSFATSISNLMQAVRSKDGIESVIKTLDGKLSEAIMHAMVNGPRLQKEVKQACGEPSLLPIEKHEPDEEQPVSLVSNKWSSPPMLEDMLNFLVVMDKSKDIYSQIIDTLCEDDEYTRDDKNCWTGSFVGEYTSSKLPTSISAQKYNPEVPYEDTTTTLRATKLTELSDEIVELQRQVANAYSTRMIDGDKMLSDMPEGSGWIDNDNDDMDDYGASGSGAGKSDTPTTRVDVSTLEDSSRTRNNNVSPSNTEHSSANLNRISAVSLFISIFLTVICLTKRLLL